VLAEEIGTPMSISSVTFTSSYVESNSYVLDFTLSMALVEADELSNQFDENYTPGSLVTVLSADSLDLGIPVGDELTLDLDEPFYYDGQSNLLLDIYYPDGFCYYSVWCWTAGEGRSLSRMFVPGTEMGSLEDPGYLFEDVPYMVLGGELGLESCTFGRIKAIPRQ